MPFNTALILLALLAQVFLTFVIYIVMVRGRFAAVRAKKVQASQYILVEGEPSDMARVTNNLRNQFELPVVFYALVLLLVAINHVTMLDVVLAWIFVIGRVIHHIVHTKSEDVLLRPRVFLIGFVAVILLAVHALIIVLGEMFT